MQRISLQPCTFKDGFTLPAGVTLAFPSLHYGLDPDQHQNPEHFDFKRHLRKRQGRGNHKFIFGSASGDSISWGVGRHACPGRFFSQETLKLMFIRLLGQHDFKHSEAAQKMPLYIFHELFIMPNPTLPILIRNKKVA